MPVKWRDNKESSAFCRQEEQKLLRRSYNQDDASDSSAIRLTRLSYDFLSFTNNSAASCNGSEQKLQSRTRLHAQGLQGSEHLDLLTETEWMSR